MELTLTKRQAQVLTHFKQGKTYEGTATDLGIDTETVRRHATNIYRRLGVKNKIEALNKFFGNQPLQNE